MREQPCRSCTGWTIQPSSFPRCLVVPQQKGKQTPRIRFSVSSGITTNCLFFFNFSSMCLGSICFEPPSSNADEEQAGEDEHVDHLERAVLLVTVLYDSSLGFSNSCLQHCILLGRHWEPFPFPIRLHWAIDCQVIFNKHFYSGVLWYCFSLSLKVAELEIRY